MIVNEVESIIPVYEMIEFKVVQKIPDKNTEWAYIKKVKLRLVSIFLSHQKEFLQLKEQKMSVGFTLRVQIKNIEEYDRQIKDKTEVIKPLGVTKYNGGMEFVIQDVNGFT